MVYEEVSLACGGEIYLLDDAPSVTINSPRFPQIPPPYTGMYTLLETKSKKFQTLPMYALQNVNGLSSLHNGKLFKSRSSKRFLFRYL